MGVSTARASDDSAPAMEGQASAALRSSDAMIKFATREQESSFAPLDPADDERVKSFVPDALDRKHGVIVT